ncbi:MAG: efflux RND transporter periplasmic adaptor subunit [Gammaproteobacteria bacterium]|nr:efflux RND transporter periplasmic adaptor subunit [Gammaproteobacteria bacterium]MDX2461247.1 efflux RND transporter periplasmic adaptor subunit [Gammaproteobacteria bacterium]
MTTDRPARWRKLLVLPPIVLGVLVLMWMAAGKQPPAEVERGEPARTVRVIEAPLLELIPKAEGYGPVRPARVWTAVAQVAGRIVEMHPRLRDGEILPEGTPLVRIDPGDYELALLQARAGLAELEVEESNAKVLLTIEEQNLNLAGQDVERKRKLKQKGTTSQSSVDDAERVMLSTRMAAQSLRNTLALIPTRRSVLEATVARAQRDLERTEIRAPFTLRVADLAIEADQYVSVGQSLFKGDDVERVEVEAQFPISTLRRLFIGRPDLKLDVARLGEQLPEVIGFDPLVRLDLGNDVAEWQAEFVRFSDNVDAQTRTMGVVVAVDRPFEKVKLGYRPPLSKGMFVQVTVRGKSQPSQVVIPRNAVRNGTVYVADEDDRLRRRPVEVLFTQGEFSVIASGLAPGERVVVSDLVPAVSGMLLRPRIDEALSAQLKRVGTQK